MAKTPRIPEFIETDIKDLWPLKKLDETLKYLLQVDTPPFRTFAEIQKELAFEADSKDLDEILLKLEKDGYIRKEIRASNKIAEYWSTFEGRFFMTETGGYLEKIQDDYQNSKVAMEEKKLTLEQIRSTIDTNENVSKTNDSVRENMNSQKNPTKAALWIAGTSAFIAFVSLFISIWPKADKVQAVILPRTDSIFLNISKRIETVSLKLQNLDSTLKVHQNDSIRKR